MTEIKNVDELHYLLIMYDNFEQLRDRTPEKTWLDEKDDTYNIQYVDGFLFSAPKDLIEILYDGAVNDVNPIIEHTETRVPINVN